MRKEAGYLVRLGAERFGDSPAFLYQDQSISFTEINRRANLLGSGLLAHGLSHGDRVGVLAFNTPEVVECWFGMEKHNLIRAVLHTHFPVSVHSGSLREIGARAFIFDWSFADDVDAIRSEIPGVSLFVCIGDRSQCPSWAVPYADIMASGSEVEPRLVVDEDAPEHIQYTSGTTGIPKPWVMSYRSWQFVIETNYSHLNTAVDAPLSRFDDVNMHFHPLQWASGFQTFYPYYIQGCATVLVDDRKFDPEVVLRTIQDQKVTGTLIPGAQLIQLLDCPNLKNYDYSSLKRVVLFFVNSDLIDRARGAFGECCINGFGSTEQGAVNARMTPAEYLWAKEHDPQRCESMGQSASPFVEIKIVNEEGQELPAGQLGELAVRSPMSTSYYWDRPDLTSKAFFADDWFRPGDIGWMSADGYLYYGDRAGDRIHGAGGEVIYPHAVENILLQHPAVAMVGVVGIPDASGDETVVACVLPKPGVEHTNQLIQELLTACQKSLKPNEVPSRVIFVSELPTVLDGAKVQKKELRARLIAQLDGSGLSVGSSEPTR